MERRRFIQNIATGLTGSLLLYENTAQVLSDLHSNIPRKKRVTFGVCTDVHHDLFPETEKRLNQFVSEANKRKADFIIQLGDFCHPREKNRGFLSTWNGFKGARYHVLGNHDMDSCSKEKVLWFWGCDPTKNYYSFDVGNFHFIVLDPNNIYKGGQYIPYNKGNYFSENGSKINHIPPGQLSWLEDDLARTSKPTVVFSHQPLNVSINNKDEAIRILNGSKNGSHNKVIACFSGHLHKNWHVYEDSLNHIQVNSMCYFWVGSRYICKTRYPEEIQKQYHNVIKMAPYKEPLYAFVELDMNNKEIRIDGKSSEFIPPTPGELGITENGTFAPSPSIDSRIINF